MYVLSSSTQISFPHFLDFTGKSLWRKKKKLAKESIWIMIRLVHLEWEGAHCHSFFHQLFKRV